jgi:hypothetical protein
VPLEIPESQTGQNFAQTAPGGFRGTSAGNNPVPLEIPESHTEQNFRQTAQDE